VLKKRLPWPLGTLRQFIGFSGNGSESYAHQIPKQTKQKRTERKRVKRNVYRRYK
jgi:hypothetical protein